MLEQKITEYSISRIENHIEALSRFSIPRRPSDGVTRLAFSRQETEALNWTRRKLVDFGYKTKYDPFLNLHAYDARGGNKRILVGTHLDSVKNGGKYDGTVGLVCFLEALHLLEKNGEEFGLPVDFVIFRAEESTLFKVALLGSKVATGYYDLEDLRDIQFSWDDELEEALIHLGYTNKTGTQLKTVTLFDILSKYNDDLMAKIRKGCWFFDYDLVEYKAYFEVHIEQGRVLETLKKDLGIVSSFRAPLRGIFTLEGRTDHSGATPMGSKYRQDVLCAASECIIAIENICKEEAGKDVDVVGTVGELRIPFMGINKIPGKCSFTLDLRSNNFEERIRISECIHKKISEICRKRSISVGYEQTENSQPVLLTNNDESLKLQDQMQRTIERLGYSCIRMASGAGHDAMRMAQVGIPTCMLFIPCRNGVSHAPEEEAKAEDILKSSFVLYSMLKSLA